MSSRVGGFANRILRMTIGFLFGEDVSDDMLELVCVADDSLSVLEPVDLSIPDEEFPPLLRVSELE